MKCEFGIWFPDSEKHLIEMMALAPQIDGRGTYQYHKLMAAMKFVGQRRCAIDVGMHVGLWSMHLVKLFNRVIGFEPVAEHIECLRRNMLGVNNYEIHHCALGNRHGTASFKFLPGSTGSTTLLDTDGEVLVMPLDSFKFEAIDFIKIDVEGYEKFVIEGAEQTIKKHRPTLIIEQKGTKGIPDRGEPYDAINLLKSWGAKQQLKIKGDFLMAF